MTPNGESEIGQQATALEHNNRYLICRPSDMVTSNAPIEICLFVEMELASRGQAKLSSIDFPFSYKHSEFQFKPLCSPI